MGDVDLKVAQTPLDFASLSRDSDVLTLVQQALRERNTQLAFQPVVAARNPSSVTFYEGLIRVRDQARRLIPAGQFMGAIAETGIGREIDCASLRLGFQVLVNNPGLRLSINMSARSMADGKWRRTLEQGLATCPSIAGRLILEISEESAMHLHEVLARFMAEMQPVGVSFALDDFGAGMISFKRLTEFSFDMVKIDRKFIRNIHADNSRAVTAEALMRVAKQYRMFVVAEGVETEAELAVLRAMGVDSVQGYLFGAPRLQI